MQQSRYFFVLAVIVITITSCIKRYYPEINSNEAQKYVVTGEVIKGDTIQNINVSQSTVLSEPYYKDYLPVLGCSVIISDNKGNVFPADGIGNGNYQAYIPDNMISIGSAFKVEVVIPISGEENIGTSVHIVSDYDTIQECPPVDSIYYQVEKLPTTDPNTVIKGIRFYYNLDATDFSCRYFRFEEDETYEYKAVFATDFPHKYCWITKRINNIFTLSTKSLSQNKFKMYPLHFVDNFSSQRLRFGYSILFRQYSLSEAAYTFWEKVRTNSEDQGGMYERQPLQITGNMHNLTSPEIAVLGFFSASDMKSKRIFVGDIDGLTSEYLDCEPPKPLSPPPSPSCYDCLLDGGTNIKPDFWPY